MTDEINSTARRMEVQMAAQAARPAARISTPPHRNNGGGAKPVPGYLRPSAGSCHHVCKYGGTHAFQFQGKEEARRAQPPRSRKQQPPASAPEPEKGRNRALVKVRSVFRRRVGDSGRADRAPGAAAGKAKIGESVEWKDIVVVACGTVPLPPQESSPEPDDKVAAHQVTSSDDDAKKKDATKGNKKKNTHDTAKINGHQVLRSGMITDIGSMEPPKGKKHPTLFVEKMAIDQETLRRGFQILSPTLLQSRANLLRDLEKEMVEDSANVKEDTTAYSLDQEECAAAAAAESSRPIPAHRRVKSMSISSRSVRYPFARQASKNSGTFKLRSRSTRAPILPPEEEKPSRLRSRRGEDPSGSTGRGIQLRIRSLRRRGLGGSSGTGTGFVVPAVALRHQKTLEKKKSQRLYNNLIEETASKLVKTRKSRVKALVGAFESVISKITK